MKHKISLCLLLSFILFFLSQPVIHANTNFVLNELAHIVTGVYKNLFDQIVEMPSREISTSAKEEMQDGYIFDIKDNKATIDLGKYDEIKQGMLLDVYREQDIYAPLTDSISLISIPMGKVVVTEVYEKTSTVRLSRFETKAEIDPQNGEIVFLIREWDRVRRPTAVEKEKTSGYTHIVSVATDTITIELDIEIGSKIQIIKEKREAPHPITKKMISFNPEKKAILQIVEKGKDESGKIISSIGKIISSEEQGRFIVNDKVLVIELD